MGQSSKEAFSDWLRETGAKEKYRMENSLEKALHVLDYIKSFINAKEWVLDQKASCEDSGAGWKSETQAGPRKIVY